MSSTNPRFARFVGHLLRGIAVLAFVAGMIAFMFFMSEHQFLPAVVVLGICLTSMPLIPEGQGDRLVAALNMFCGFLGLLAGVVIYFAMFSFSWFAAIFNGKGGGPAGLLLFAISFAFAGGYLGYRGLHFLQRRPDSSRPDSE
jgi:hypothetical protein